MLWQNDGCLGQIGGLKKKKIKDQNCWLESFLDKLPFGLDLR